MSAPTFHSPLRSQAVLRLFLTTAAWALSFPLFKMLFAVQQQHIPDAGSVFLAAHAIGLRSVIAASILLMFLPGLLRNLTVLEKKQAALLGLFGGLGLIIQADALSYTSASVSAFLTQSYCIILPAWACLRRRQWPRARLTICTLLVTMGILQLSGLTWENFQLGRGEIETIVSALFFTAQILVLEAGSFRENRMIKVTVLMFIGFAVCAVPMVLVTMPSLGALTAIYHGPCEMTIMLTIVLFCTLYAYTTMNRWQPHVSAAEAGLIYTAEPVFAACFSLFLPGWLSAWSGVAYANETLTRDLIIGGLLITGANALLQLRFRRFRWRPRPTPL